MYVKSGVLCTYLCIQVFVSMCRGKHLFTSTTLLRVFLQKLFAPVNIKYPCLLQLQIAIYFRQLFSFSARDFPQHLPSSNRVHSHPIYTNLILISRAISL